jgi:hypothetical protein
VYSVTSAPQSLQDDQSYRMRRYLLSMGTRTACFLLAVLFIAVLHWTVAGWVMVVGAVVLPYFAVVMANVSRSPFSAPLGPVTPSHRALEGQAPPPGADDARPSGPRGPRGPRDTRGPEGNGKSARRP